MRVAKYCLYIASYSIIYEVYHKGMLWLQLSKDLETEQQLNISMRQGKQEWVSKVVNLQTTLEQKDQVSSILMSFVLHHSIMLPTLALMLP